MRASGAAEGMTPMAPLGLVAALPVGAPGAAAGAGVPADTVVTAGAAPAPGPLLTTEYPPWARAAPEHSTIATRTVAACRVFIGKDCSTTAGVSPSLHRVSGRTVDPGADAVPRQGVRRKVVAR